MMQHRNRRPGRHFVGRSHTDRAFDELVPEELRHLSATHWTPVEVAIRTAALLAPGPRMRILDIGSGVGKLCAIGAVSSTGTWCGVEQHEPLVRAANRLAQGLGVAARTSFLHGDAFAIDWSGFDALYLYNPFELPLFGSHGSVDRGAIDYQVQVARVQSRLAELPAGTRVVTLHGFGGTMPASYELLFCERVVTVGLDLALWVQGSRVRKVKVLS